MKDGGEQYEYMAGRAAVSYKKKLQYMTDRVSKARFFRYQSQDSCAKTSKQQVLCLIDGIPHCDINMRILFP